MKSGITQSELKFHFDYDAENGILIRKLKSGEYRRCGDKPTSKGYGRVRINNVQYYTHRLIWLWHYGEFPSEFIDHIDQNRMNNRIENLREVDTKINGHNCKPNSLNSSGVVGVSWDKNSKRYHVRIQVNNKRIHIGLFSNYDDAIHAAKLAKIQYHPTSPDAKKYALELGINFSIDNQVLVG